MTPKDTRDWYLVKSWKLLCIISFLIWTIVFIQVFFADSLGSSLNTVFPNATWLENYRILLFILLIGLVSFITGIKFVLTLFLFIIAYPVIFFVWSIPKLLFWTIPKFLQRKNSGFGLYFFFNQVFNFFLKMRRHLIYLSLFVLSLGVLSNSTNSTALYGSSIVLLLLLLWHLVNRTQIAINSDVLISSDIPSIPKDRLKLNTENTNEMDATQKNKINWKEQNVISYQILNFINDKAQTIKRDKNYILMLLYRVSISYMLCLIVLSLVNYSINLADSLTFVTSESISLFDSFFYTFKSMYGSEVSFMLPTSEYARLINILAPMCSGFIFFFIVTVFILIHSDKYSERLDSAIQLTELSLRDMENDFEEAYSTNINEAYISFKTDNKSSIYLFLKYFVGQSEKEIVEI